MKKLPVFRKSLLWLLTLCLLCAPAAPLRAHGEELQTETPQPATEAPAEEATEEPTETPTDVPTDTPTPTDAPTDVPTDTPEPTATPTDVPTDTPTPTATPTDVPTDTPEPTATPTDVPTDTPEPTATPTDVPTDTPEPTATPTDVPTDTPEPTDAPTDVPTDTPTPTDEPTATPTEEPADYVSGAVTVRYADGVVAVEGEASADDIAAAVAAAAQLPLPIQARSVQLTGAITGGSAEIALPVLASASAVIRGGVFRGAVSGAARLEDGEFYAIVETCGSLLGGAYHDDVRVYVPEASLMRALPEEGACVGEPQTPCAAVFDEDVTLTLEAGVTLYDGVFACRVVNRGVICDGDFSGAVENEGEIRGGVFDGALINRGAVEKAQINGSVQAQGGEIAQCEFGADASVQSEGGAVEVIYYIDTPDVPLTARYGASVLETLGAPAPGSAWYRDEGSLKLLVGSGDTFPLRPTLYRQQPLPPAEIDWASLSAAPIVYGQPLSASALSQNDPLGVFSWAQPDKIPTVAEGAAGLPVVFTPSDEARLTYDYSQTVLTGSVVLAVSPRPVTLTAATLTKEYGQPDPALTASAEGALPGDTLQYALRREAGENVGEYAVTVTPLDNPNYLVSAVSGALRITAKPLSRGVTIAPIPDQTYTGAPLTPLPVVRDGERTLTLNTDYTLSYTGSTGPGTAQVTVTGCGNYQGTLTAAFDIVLPATRRPTDPPRPLARYGDAPLPTPSALGTFVALCQGGDEDAFVRLGLVQDGQNGEQPYRLLRLPSGSFGASDEGAGLLVQSAAVSAAALEARQLTVNLAQLLRMTYSLPSPHLLFAHGGATVDLPVADILAAAAPPTATPAVPSTVAPTLAPAAQEELWAAFELRVRIAPTDGGYDVAIALCRGGVESDITALLPNAAVCLYAESLPARRTIDFTARDGAVRALTAATRLNNAEEPYQGFEIDYAAGIPRALPLTRSAATPLATGLNAPLQGAGVYALPTAP